MKLYDYYRSSASYRVRIALNLKNIPYEKFSVHLVNNGGEQHQAAYLKLNPQGLVPSLEVDGQILSQSLAIIEYLDETNPNPPLLPDNALARAQVRAMALTIACEIHPLNNLRVLACLRLEMKADEQQIKDWYHHWLGLGFDTLENKLKKSSDNKFCYGNQPSLADICLIPQVYNAYRFDFSMENYPLIQAIYAHCTSLKSFKDAAPD